MSSTRLPAAPALIALTEAGARLARRLVGDLPDAVIHGLEGRASGDLSFSRTGLHLRGLFAAGTPIIGICAAGILIRCLAPSLTDKRREPPVLALSEDGAVVVPLLGGHHGANELAERLAALTGGQAAVTTASDRRLGVAIDDPPPGWVLDPSSDTKGVIASMLAGEGVRLEGDLPWAAAKGWQVDPAAARSIQVSDGAAGAVPGSILYRPRVLALGVGCERGVDPATALDLAGSVLVEAGLAAGAVGAVVSLDLKEDEPAIHQLAQKLGCAARFFEAGRLEAETPRLSTPSETVYEAVGCHGVAEGAALAAVGANGELVVPKRIRNGVTCALARAALPLDPDHIGRPRGRLAIVGLGPGQAAWRAPEADTLLRQAEALVGYHGYLDLLGPGTSHQERFGFELGEERQRVERALSLAAEGRFTALVGSGDAGIYAMGALVYEQVAEQPPGHPWHRLDIAVSPGISALQAAAARAGAPLGHDFCAISLSDLLTPWPEIEVRIEAAAAGDFVIAFYNPASKARVRQLAAARRLLLEHRAPDTPVIVARNLGREGESLVITDLAELPAAAVDMMSIVLVGSSQTRTLARPDGGHWVFTPRGYSGPGRPDPADGP